MRRAKGLSRSLLSQFILPMQRLLFNFDIFYCNIKYVPLSIPMSLNIGIWVNSERVYLVLQSRERYNIMGS
jgi:hypothetical protein